MQRKPKRVLKLILVLILVVLCVKVISTMFSIIKDALSIFLQTTCLYERSMLVKENFSSKSVSETTRPIFHKSKSCRKDQTNAGQCAIFNGVCPPNFNCTGTAPDDICCGIDPFILAKKFIGNMQKFSSKHTKSDLCKERSLSKIHISLKPETESNVGNFFEDLEQGGRWAPQNCTALYKIAIIVPFRDRKEHIAIFLKHMHKFLRLQQLDYGIFIMEQVKNQTFNKSRLMNTGFVLASQLYNWDCYIFHDIDSLPEDLRNAYKCSDKNPRHLGIHISKFNYTLLYNDFLGGATAFTYDQFKNVNGFPNDYWGWGGEDDDMALRISYAGYKIERIQPMYGNYTTIPHKQDHSNPANDCRWIMLRFTKNRWRKDGLSNLIFRIEMAEKRKLYTHFLIDLNEEESRKWFKTQLISKACDLMRSFQLT